jgi:hypothetical protein
LSELCPPHLGEVAGNKRACSHNYFLSHLCFFTISRWCTATGEGAAWLLPWRNNR